MRMTRLSRPFIRYKQGGDFPTGRWQGTEQMGRTYVSTYVVIIYPKQLTINKCNLSILVTHGELCKCIAQRQRAISWESSWDLD